MAREHREDGFGGGDLHLSFQALADLLRVARFFQRLQRLFANRQQCGPIDTTYMLVRAHEDVEATRPGGCLLKVRHVSLRYLGIALRAASSKALIALA